MKKQLDIKKLLLLNMLCISNGRRWFCWTENSLRRNRIMLDSLLRFIPVIFSVSILRTPHRKPLVYDFLLIASDFRFLVFILCHILIRPPVSL